MPDPNLPGDSSSLSSNEPWELRPWVLGRPWPSRPLTLQPWGSREGGTPPHFFA